MTEKPDLFEALRVLAVQAEEMWQRPYSHPEIESSICSDGSGELKVSVVYSNGNYDVFLELPFNTRNELDEFISKVLSGEFSLVKTCDLCTGKELAIHTKDGIDLCGVHAEEYERAMNGARVFFCSSGMRAKDNPELQEKVLKQLTPSER